MPETFKNFIGGEWVAARAGATFDKRNPAGWTSEKWYHGFGCRRFLYIERHTVTNEVRACAPAAPLEANQ